ncbi:hypothetical protein Hanom_Chr05g00467031 [Helianthus anomalus]
MGRFKLVLYRPIFRRKKKHKKIYHFETGQMGRTGKIFGHPKCANPKIRIY